MKSGATVVTSLAAALLLAAVVLVLARDQFQQQPKFSGRVEDLLPKPNEFPEWTVRYAPIADTPEMKAKVGELLNYDQAVFAIYTRGVDRISVYLAYWKPGNMPVRGIARHTPDVCWVESGWKRERREEIANLSVNAKPVAHTEHGVFSINGQSEDVVFWHLADGEVISYHTQARPPWHAAITEFLRWGNQFKQEQFFLRISSNRPLEEYWSAEITRSVVSRVPGVLGQATKP